MKKYTKTLRTINEFVDHVKTLNLTPKKELNTIREYKQFLDSIPERTDFINYDNEGFDLFHNKPLIKGFVSCDEASSDTKKVALNQNTRLYFHEDDDVKGVVLYHTNFATDQCTYNELAIAFNPKNSLDYLEFT